MDTNTAENPSKTQVGTGVDVRAAAFPVTPTEWPPVRANILNFRAAIFSPVTFLPRPPKVR